MTRRDPDEALLSCQCLIHLKVENRLGRSVRCPRGANTSGERQPPPLCQSSSQKNHFLMQNPIVGVVPHLDPSGAPPFGQNTVTSVSFASQPMSRAEVDALAQDSLACND